MMALENQVDLIIGTMNITWWVVRVAQSSQVTHVTQKKKKFTYSMKITVAIKTNFSTNNSQR